MNEPARLIDLFAGAGGMTLGFTDARFGGGFECVLSVDNDKAAMLTHKAAFGGKPVVKPIELWMQEEPQIPQADIVVGGPPCQGFSLLNRNRSGDRRRELWEPYLDVVQLSGARYFVMENVPELLKSDEFALIQERAESIGFHTKARVLNAADFGAPQTRRRGIILGWKYQDAAEPQYPQPTHSRDPKNTGLKPWVTVKDVISNLPEPEGITIRDNLPGPLNLHFGRTPTPMSVARYKAVPLGGNRFDLQRNAPEITPACWLRKPSGGTDLFGRLWWDRPSVTIRTEFYKPEKGRYLHPEANRPITHREAARLMGFPDDFPFKGSKIEIARQIGNAVPPALGGAISKSVLAALKDSTNKVLVDQF